MRLSLFTVLSTILLFGAACESAEEQRPSAEEHNMAVTYSSLDGAWQATIIDGRELADDTFCYVEFDRSERRFELYDNFATMYTRHTSGSFAIEIDEYDRYILSGTYDYGVGDWSTEYIVEMNSTGDTMVWQSIATDEKTTYRRVEAIPEDMKH